MNELTINLSKSSKEPLYEQIYEYIKNDIQKGRLLAKDKLPSTRKLAGYLGISRSTVDMAYEQLISEGYIEAVPYKGYFVNMIDELYKTMDFVEKYEENSYTKDERFKYNFEINGIDFNNFPFNTWRKITKNTLIDDKKGLFFLGSPLGDLSLRTTIAGYLHQARGVNCSPEQIVIGAGNDYLLMLLSSIDNISNKSIAMENYTYKQAYKIFKNQGYNVKAVSIDKDGMEIENLYGSGADIAYVMPSHQFPLGIAMPINRRFELLKWAAQAENRYIIEDDYDSEFRYRGKPIPALQGYDKNSKVIYLGTFSKSVAPAIRISYMVLPRKLMNQLRDNILLYSSTVSRIDQTIINVFIKEGYFERYLNKMRAIYKNKHDLLVTELRKFSKYFDIAGENSGLHVLLNFKSAKYTEEEIIKIFEKYSIKIYGLNEFAITQQHNKKPTILLGYATMSEDNIFESMRLFKNIMDKEMSFDF